MPGSDREELKVGDIVTGTQVGKGDVVCESFSDGSLTVRLTKSNRVLHDTRWRGMCLKATGAYVSLIGKETGVFGSGLATVTLVSRCSDLRWDKSTLEKFIEAYGSSGAYVLPEEILTLMDNNDHETLAELARRIEAEALWSSAEVAKEMLKEKVGDGA